MLTKQNKKHWNFDFKMRKHGNCWKTWKNLCDEKMRWKKVDSELSLRELKMMSSSTCSLKWLDKLQHEILNQMIIYITLGITLDVIGGCRRLLKAVSQRLSTALRRRSPEPRRQEAFSIFAASQQLPVSTVKPAKIIFAIWNFKKCV